MKQCTATNFSKLSSFKLMQLSDCTFLNIENDSSKSHEETSAYTESSKYYARPQMAVARGLDLPTHGLAGRQTATASKHSLCYFSLFSK